MKLLVLILLGASVVFAQASGCGNTPYTGAVWTSSTSNNTTQTLAQAASGTHVLVTLDQTTTLTGGAIQFQADPGDGNLVNLQAWQVVDPTSSTYAQVSMPYTLQASTNKQFLIYMAGAYKLVLKLTTAITGTANVTPYATCVCYAVALPVTVANTPNVNGALSNNGAAAGTNRLGELPGIIQTDPSNGSAETQGRDAALNVGTDGTLWTSLIPGLRPASYEASANFAASSTTDNACIYGNSTNTVLLYEADVSGIQTTAGLVNVQLIRHSAAESGGTSANMTAVRGDVTNYAAASTTPVSYTGTGPTAGASVGTIHQAYTAFLVSASTVPDDLFIWNGRLKPQILIGTGQGVCVNLGNAALTGGTINVTFRWLEIKNISE